MSFYDDASWLLIPSGIEEDVVYAQKPTSGLGDLTFTRASDATYTDSTGVVRRSPYNLLTFSEDLSNVAWQKLFASISSNVTTAPNGLLTADKLVEDTTNASHTIFQTISISASTNYNYSVYLKAAERFRFRIRFTGFSGAQDNSVDLNLGTAFAGTLTSVGNGWFRLTWPINSGTGAGSPLVAITLQDASGNSTYLGNGTSGAFIWGAQLVEGTSALDYFPTTNRQDVPRIDFRNADGTLSSCGRLLLEPQRTNSIRNSSMVGAVAGTPGTLPTNYGEYLSGLTRTVAGIGTENGVPYIDLRFNGTASDTIILINFETTSGISALNGQNWSNSFYVKTIATPQPPLKYALRSTQRSSGSNVGSFILEFTPTTTLARYTQTFTTNNATITHIQPYISFDLTIGQTYDFTIRIAAPQMELGAYATTFIPTTTAAVTRLADSAVKEGVPSLIGQSEGTLYFEGFCQDSSELMNVNRSTVNSVFLLMSSGIIRATIYANSTTFSLTSSVSGLNYFKAAVAYKSNSFALYVNGVLAAQNTTATFTPNVQMSRIDIATGNYVTGKNTVNCAQAALFPTRLDNAQLAQLTTL